MMATITSLLLISTIVAGQPTRRSVIQVVEEKMQNKFISQLENIPINEKHKREVYSGGERQKVCGVSSSHVTIGGLEVPVRVCSSPGKHELLGDMYMCRQEFLKVPGINILVPSGCTLAKEDNDNKLLQLARVEETINEEEQVVERICEGEGHHAGRFHLNGHEYWCLQEYLIFPHLKERVASSCSCHILHT